MFREHSIVLNAESPGKVKPLGGVVDFELDKEITKQFLFTGQLV